MYQIKQTYLKFKLITFNFDVIFSIARSKLSQRFLKIQIFVFRVENFFVYFWQNKRDKKIKNKKLIIKAMDIVRNVIETLRSCCLGCSEEETRPGEPTERSHLLSQQQNHISPIR